MASVNLRQLRDTRRLKALLRRGKTVELRERNRVIARIVPDQQDSRLRAYPDFAARRRKIFRGRVLPAAKIVIEGRGRY